MILRRMRHQGGIDPCLVPQVLLKVYSVEVNLDDTKEPIPRECLPHTVRNPELSQA